MGWLRPTSRATALRPLLGITLAMMLLAVVVGRQSSGVPEVLVFAICGGLAAGVVLGLDDEAHQMTGPLPTPALVRLGQRLAFLLPLTIVCAATLLVAAHLASRPALATPPAVAFGALVSAAIAGRVWLGRHWPDEASEVAAGCVTVWALSGTVLPDRWVPRAISETWLQHPWWVLVVSVVLIVAGTAGREA